MWSFDSKVRIPNPHFALHLNLNGVFHFQTPPRFCRGMTLREKFRKQSGGGNLHP